MLNKFLIPAALVATVVIAGIFAFMPVEKASTVHGTLATSASITSLGSDVTSEVDNQNRAISFYLNMSHPNNRPGGNNVTVVLSEPGKTFTGYAMLTAIPNNGTGNDVVRTMNCGLQTTGEDGTRNKLGLNATAGMSNFTRFSAANGLTANEGIAVVLSNGSGTYNMVGVCAGTIVLTSWGS
ncbi:MAG: hypothetical protein FJ356_03125 [Thaumarchaeota archaeon]|nr:hypothetical protein [Nitrososphaerota archaeon]